MADRSAFSYAIVRVMPSVERGETLNVGVVLYARQHGFLAARVALDEQKLAVVAPAANVAAIKQQLDAVVRVAEGNTDAGPIAALDQSERFGWLVAPASTVIQTSPVHTGLCDDPELALDELFEDLVR
jgi:Protein of unknown function (DUF3037)